MWIYRKRRWQSRRCKLYALLLCLFLLASCSSASIESSLPENDPSNTFSDDAEETWRYSLQSSSSELLSSSESSSEESVPSTASKEISPSSTTPEILNSEVTFIQYDDEFNEVKTGDIVGPFTVMETTATYKKNHGEGALDSPLYSEPGYVLSSADIQYQGRSEELTGWVSILRSSEFYGVIRFIPDASSIIKLPLIAEDVTDFYIMIPANRQGDFRSDWDGKKRVYVKLSEIHLVYGIEGSHNEATLSSYRFVES